MILRWRFSSGSLFPRLSWYIIVFKFLLFHMAHFIDVLLLLFLFYRRKRWGTVKWVRTVTLWRRKLRLSVSAERIPTQVRFPFIGDQCCIDEFVSISLSGFSLTSESQGPLDFASTQLLASEDSNSAALYEPGAKRLRTDWHGETLQFDKLLCTDLSQHAVDQYTISFSRNSSFKKI